MWIYDEWHNYGLSFIGNVASEDGQQFKIIIYSDTKATCVRNLCLTTIRRQML